MSIAIAALVLVGFGIIALTGLFESHNRKIEKPVRRPVVYRIWLEDSVEPAGGFWWYCQDDGDGYLRQIGFDYTGKEDQLTRLSDYDGYKIERVTQ